MISIILILLCFFAVNIFIGQAIFPTKSNRLALFQPLAGVALAIIILSSSFLLNISLSYVFAIVLIILAPLILRRFNLKRFTTHLSLLTASIFLCFLPYFLINGNNLKITGYMISNDTVVNAILSRTCSDNESIYSKIYTSSFECASEYPVGAHSLVNLLSTISNIDTSFIVIPVSLFFISLNSFIVLYLLLSLTNKHKKFAYLLSPVIAASYFYLAIAYHGFLTQSAYVPFVLAFAFILFEPKSILSNTYKVFLLALFSASSIVIYSFVSVLAIIMFVTVYLITQYIGLSYGFKIVLTAGLISALLIGSNYIVVSSFVVDLFNSVSGESVIYSQSQSLGNLLGFIDTRIGSGVWFEVDYRFMKQAGFRNIMQVTISTVITLIAFIFYLQLLLKRNPFGFVINSKVLDYGCGAGDYAVHFSSISNNVVGLDRDVTRAKKSSKSVRWIAHSATKLPFASNTFDYLIFVNVIEHMHDYEGTMKEVLRVLKKGGKLFITTYDTEFLLHKILYDKTHLYEWTEPEFTDFVGQYVQVIQAFKYGSFFNYYPANFLLKELLRPELCVLAKKN